MRLIINGYNIELESKTKISRTLQVNDIANLQNRQSNYSSTFKIPRTANNIRAFNKLGIVGNNSNTPYQRNNTYLYTKNEECLVYNGWAIIKSTEEDYKVNILDGNIDLYKAIESTTLSDLDLTEINHNKTLNNVLDSFNNLTDYKYIVADYNGKMLYDTNKINIDYLVPSIPISYLWEKVFETYGFTYSGNVFNTFNFQNLHITYPKGTEDVTQVPVNYYSGSWTNFDTPDPDIIGITHVTPSPTEGTFLTNNIDYVTPTDGTYVVSSALTAVITIEDNYNNFITLTSGQYDIGVIVNNNINSFQSLDTDIYLNLNAGDVITLFIENHVSREFVSCILDGTVDYNFLSGYVIDFNATFIDFKTKDFISMVLNRFGLTPFKDKYTNHYDFLTIEERLQDSDIDDWSSKFVGKNKETYIYGSYAQENNFLYKYNDKESTYYNGYIYIDNKNLNESKDVVTSKIYAPEKIKTSIFEKETNVYKLWEKEVQDDSSVEYKELEKRFYLMRYNDYTFDVPVTLGSEFLQDEQVITTAPFESFFKLKWTDIIGDYYADMTQLLDNARIDTNNIYLTETDISNINFKTLKWIEQLSSYYILNKISNFSEDGIYKCEMIKVDYVNAMYQGAYAITINSFDGNCLYYTSSISGVVQVFYSNDSGITYQPLPYINGGGSFIINGQICGLTLTNGWYVRLYNPTTLEFISNTIVI